VSTAPDAVRIFAAERLDVGECPLIDPDVDALFAVDIPNGRMWRWDLGDGRSDSLDVGEPLGSIALVDGGGFLLATRTGVLVLDNWNGRPRLLCELEPELPTQCNDGRCDPMGRFVVGTATTDQSCLGALYVVDHDGSARQLVAGVGMSNGLDWSPDGRWLYFVDSIAGTVTRYPWYTDDATVGDPRVVLSLSSREGLPDGLVVDGDGCLWVALWGAGEIRRYDDAGRRIATISLPTPYVTSCAFGARGNELFVTSAVGGLTEGEPGFEHAGSVFAVPTSATGRPAIRFELAASAA
jgi:sugar lactone lactonase YvrE